MYRSTGINAPGSNRLLRPIGRGLLLAVIACGVGGCAIASYLAHVAGSPPVPAQYVPAKTPMAILVRDSPDPGGQLLESEDLAAYIERELNAHQIAPIVPPVKISEIRDREPVSFATRTPAQLGGDVGAAQILVVQIQGSTVQSDDSGDMLKGNISVVASVYDTKSGTLLFPTDGSGGVILNYSTPAMREREQTTAASVRENLHLGIADKIGKLFYTYKPD